MWAILGVLEKYKNQPVAFGGITVGNLIPMLPDEDMDEIGPAFDALERNGWLEVHQVNGVKHANLKEA